MRTALALVLFATLGAAAEPVTLRTELRPGPEPWVGQRVSLYVTVVMAGSPSRSPRFELPLVPGAVFLQAPGSPLLGSERREGVEHTTQRFELLAFVQRAGPLLMGPVTVRVELDGTEHVLKTEPQQLDARLPEGVPPGLTRITSKDVSIAQRWEPDQREATVGDAFVRRVTIRAADQMAIAIPPAPVPELTGLGAYAAAPVVEDRLSRGALTGERTDEVTFVCEAAGTYELPDLVYAWWNPVAARLEQHVLEGRTLVVAAAPVVASAHEAEAESAGSAWWAVLVSGSALAGSAWITRRRVATWWGERRRRRAASEAVAFARLARACRVGDAPAAWHDLLTWLRRIEPGGQAVVVGEFAARHGSRSLDDAAVVLQQALLDGSRWSGGDLLTSSAELRRVVRSSRQSSRSGWDARELNPRPQ